MGLFNFFRKSVHSHGEKVDLAYGCYKADMVETLFPGGKTQANNVIVSLAKVFSLNLDQCDAKVYHNLLTIYSDVVIRKVITQVSDAQILNSLRMKHADWVKDMDLAKKSLAYISINMVNNAFALQSKEDFDAITLFAEMYSQTEEVVTKNKENEVENFVDSEYGLVSNKPIYTEGVNGSKKYLALLMTSQGETLAWNRRGSISVEGINGFIDIYDGNLPSGELYKTLYLNMYGSKNSTKIPNGFIC